MSTKGIGQGCPLSSRPEASGPSTHLPQQYEALWGKLICHPSPPAPVMSSSTWETKAMKCLKSSAWFWRETVVDRTVPVLKCWSSHHPSDSSGDRTSATAKVQQGQKGGALTQEEQWPPRKRDKHTRHLRTQSEGGQRSLEESLTENLVCPHFDDHFAASRTARNQLPFDAQSVDLWGQSEWTCIR